MVGGEFKVVDHVGEDFRTRSTGEVEHERLLDSLYPGHIAVKILQRAVGIGAEEACLGLIEGLIGRIIPVGVLLRVDQNLVGRVDQRVRPVPV